ncbi:MAG: hypothetical protein HYR96_02920 [Deltaproteobacteria bacterium]|nr:hypothetical protein [Deltaproteobacteria bacterium]MBI3294052.1 hypothetical protein [Deltaproteobacteria bacterium]
MKNLATVIAMGMGLVAMAAHEGTPGSIGYLVGESAELNQMVQYSYLNYQVKSVVNDFDYRTRELQQCAQYRGRGLNAGLIRLMDHVGGEFVDDHSGEGCPAECRFQLQNVQNSFRQVERFLYDTQRDFPQIFQQYLNVRQAVNSLGMVGPGPGPGPGPIVNPTTVSCVAVDNGWEEHFGGHVGYGRNVYEAQRNALMQCQRTHGRCRIQSCR